MKQIKRSVNWGSRRGWIKTEGENDLTKCALSVASSTDCPRRLRLNLPSATCPVLCPRRTAPPTRSLLPSIASLLKPPPSNNRHHRLRTLLLRSFR